EAGAGAGAGTLTGAGVVVDGMGLAGGAGRSKRMSSTTIAVRPMAIGATSANLRSRGLGLLSLMSVP
ncbi:MAG: hypothetical protein B7Z12_11590, partial [Caulobacter vibrioides]